MFEELIAHKLSHIMNPLLYLKNGFYIPFIGYLLFSYTNDFFLSSIIVMKLFPANFFYWFCEKMYFFKEPYQNYNQLKQFVRFTDSGHIASFIYYFSPDFLPIAFNIHFVITSGYWLGKFVFKMRDADEIDNPEYIKWFNNYWTYFNHGAPLLLFIAKTCENKIKSQEDSDLICYNYFTQNDLFYSYVWAYCWFIFIYIPWRILTNDPVYDILGDNVTNFTKFKFIFTIHCLIYISNNFGYIISTNCCQ